MLSLPSSVAWMGWVGGILALLAFAAITLHTSQLLACCFYTRGERNSTYRDVVRSVFGRRGGNALAWLQYTNLVRCRGRGAGWRGAAALQPAATAAGRHPSAAACPPPARPSRCAWPQHHFAAAHPALPAPVQVLTGLSYNIAGALSLQQIAELASGASPLRLWQCCLIFAGGQLLLSQIPSLDEAWWASVLGAVMSFGYSTIAVALSIDKVAEGERAARGARGAGHMREGPGWLRLRSLPPAR